MSDLIDRQALLKQIDIDSDGEPGYYGDTWKFIDTIKNMPNVHDLPKDTDTISRQAAISAICNACGKIDCDKMDKCEKLQLPPANNSEIPNSSDTISRAKAMNALTDENIINHMDSVHDSELHRCKRAFERILSQLPPTQPEPDIDEVVCENCDYSEKYVDGLILCRRTKTSHRVYATSTCGKGKREVEDAEAKV